jgi:hypothetical protein
MTPSRIEPATFRIAAEHLTNCATVVGGGSSNPQTSAPGYIKLVVAEILELVVSVH